MPRYLDSDEQRAEYIQVMGVDLGQICFDLREDFDWLNYKWEEFRELYAKGAARIDFLNSVAPTFFISCTR